MTDFQRYAIYWAPEPGPLAEFGAAWLGWDAAHGIDREHPALPGAPRPVAELTDTPRKYGFHGTLKPPFRLVDGASAAGLHGAVERLAASLAPVTLDGLALHRLGGFLALVPTGDTAALEALAAKAVQDLDPYRAALTPEALMRRQSARLTDAQKALLDRWGYPYVMQEFRFHLTLTGALPEDEARTLEGLLAPVVAPLLPQPFVIRDICLFGEAGDGRFHILHRYALSG
ncbi:DUF1045 domain-containing protein [Frigidibacter mobilis]|uniref:Phosphonate metabolism protein n=1 Tax=Frigidibacter mobilis TaxID=1335048 RepID=A0A161GJT2_9RHOB|nr:DUF1045 domain-containing protein [Frigidibacter mobilis]AMY69403.1 hypothetical protein AKL17_2157 [Frigidibacter mobilis]